MKFDDYAMLIGLEVHVQLATRSKLFCGCSTQFGQPPNTQTCPVCLGLPGSLPVMNKYALELALRTAVALNCTIPPIAKWDRKQYYYPDLPKGYQISQYDQPMSHDGWLEIEVAGAPRRIGIIRAHLEEDAGKSMHDEHAGTSDSRIDLNRTGTPLLEIVTAPDLRTPEEARVFLNDLKLLLTYLGVSDCNMQEGSLRVDANVNLVIPSADAEVATPVVEVKNMNSFRAVERALAYESSRQFAAWQESGLTKGTVPKQTRGWDDQKEITLPLRSKEESSDYRYFPDPDLVPVRISTERVEELRKSLGVLPAALRRELQDQQGLSEYEADVLVNQGRPLVEYFLRVVDASGDAKQASNWIQRDVLRLLKERGLSITELPVSPEDLGALIRKTFIGELESGRAREAFAYMSEHRVSIADAIASLGIRQIDSSTTESLCRELLGTHPQIVRDVQAGNLKAIGALIGKAKKLNPNVDPNQLRETCLRLIAEQTHD
jgi:aspartyl-tRNA(Asn)/glutamyl-tRNA(Gln) amidotransferase subunit B